ncbi:MAG: sigma-70 family RNA polymerase sigma factor [Actinobacteria bacterium]|nr:sigma-70 family RNA polymerase sigma factor [Actinomycetota bacterium]
MSESSERRDRFEELAALVYEPVQRYLLRRLNPEDAADVLSETMLTLWRRLDDIPSHNRVPWSYGVARRVMANYRRGQRRHLQLVERLEREPPPPPPGAGGESGDTELTAALARLSPSDQELLRLWAWEGLEPRDIAPVLGLTINAATIRLSRARKKLGEGLKDRGRFRTQEDTTQEGAAG